MHSAFRPAARNPGLRLAALAAAWSLGLLAASALALGAQAVPEIRGVVLDVETDRGVPDVILRVLGTDVSAATDPEGRFTLRAVPAGDWELEVIHIRYGRNVHPISVREGVTVRLEVRVAEEAIQLDELVVEGETTIERERRTTGASFWEVDRAEIEAAIGTSRHMGDLVRQTIPGLKLRQSNTLSRTDICLEFRAAASISIVNSRPCNHPKVYLDGVPVSDPQYLYGAVPLGDLERIQVIPPGEASTRYGSGSLYGVLLIETRRPGLDPRAGADLLAGGGSVRTFDWEQDPEGHPFGKALLGATLGNLVGLGLGVAIGRECILVADRQIRSTCGTATTGAAGASAVVFPALGAALGARWGGGTSVSQGNLVPALVGAGLMLFPGYAFSLSTVGQGSAAVNTAGTVFLVVGVPLAVTLADRLYRKLR
jgi:hypothetical protein